MLDVRTITTRALHDALAIRGLEAGGGGFMRTTPPEFYMSADRLRLAQAVAKHLPSTVSPAGMTTLVEQLVPVVSRAMRDGVAPGPSGPVRFLS